MDKTSRRDDTLLDDQDHQDGGLYNEDDLLNIKKMFQQEYDTEP